VLNFGAQVVNNRFVTDCVAILVPSARPFRRAVATSTAASRLALLLERRFFFSTYYPAPWAAQLPVHLLTGDAGRDGMAEAANHAPNAGLHLPGVKQFRVRHHVGRRNLSTEICDRWLGPRLPSYPRGSETFQALISSAKDQVEVLAPDIVRKMIEPHQRTDFLALSYLQPSSRPTKSLEIQSRRSYILLSISRR